VLERVRREWSRAGTKVALASRERDGLNGFCADLIGGRRNVRNARSVWRRLECENGMCVAMAATLRVHAFAGHFPPFPSLHPPAMAIHRTALALLLACALAAAQTYPSYPAPAPSYPSYPSYGLVFSQTDK
jgi:hypothetical protein